jgi:peptidoglycan hydrolase-like protein with peptidoglycan-binding domain
MKLGWKNDGVEVAKLQAFLKNVEKLDVDVTGTFDQKTEDAVKAFQSKNLEKTMGPWGATKPSGFVYITTGKVINQIACASPLTLSADELAIIEAYKNRSVDVEVIGSDTTTGSSTATSSDEIGSNDSNVAGAGDASILSKFWNFLKNLFK